MEICTDLKNDHFDFYIPGLHTTAKTDRLASVDQFKITLYKMCICRKCPMSHKDYNTRVLYIYMSRVL